MQRPRILFVCTGNSARSIMAEALLRHRAGHRFEALSAGTEPGGVNPLTLRVLREIGVDTGGLSSKSTSALPERPISDHAVFVCEAANRSCPRIGPLAAQTHRWLLDDPAAATGDENRRLAEFRRVRDEIDARIRHWIAAYELY
jgi:arsenate reductase